MFFFFKKCSSDTQATHVLIGQVPGNVCLPSAVRDGCGQGVSLRSPGHGVGSGSAQASPAPTSALCWAAGRGQAGANTPQSQQDLALNPHGLHV